MLIDSLNKPVVITGNFQLPASKTEYNHINFKITNKHYYMMLGNTSINFNDIKVNDSFLNLGYAIITKGSSSLITNITNYLKQLNKIVVVKKNNLTFNPLSDNIIFTLKNMNHCKISKEGKIKYYFGNTYISFNNLNTLTNLSSDKPLTLVKSKKNFGHALANNIFSLYYLLIQGKKINNDVIINDKKEVNGEKINGFANTTIIVSLVLAISLTIVILIIKFSH